MTYRQSKLANIVYAAELARRYPAITSVSIHPGVIDTGLVSNLPRLHKVSKFRTELGLQIELGVPLLPKNDYLLLPPYDFIQHHTKPNMQS